MNFWVKNTLKTNRNHTIARLKSWNYEYKGESRIFKGENKEPTIYHKFALKYIFFPYILLLRWIK